MYVSKNVALIFIWLVTLGLVGIFSLFVVLVRTLWKRLREEPTVKHKLEFAVILVFAIPIGLAMAWFLSVAVLLSLGIVE